jgi:hypothetical protein
VDNPWLAIGLQHLHEKNGIKFDESFMLKSAVAMAII